MDYIKNETGDIKCFDSKGKVKWFPIAVIMDSHLMQDSGFIIAKAPILLEPIAEQVAESIPVKVDGRKKAQ